MIPDSMSALNQTTSVLPQPSVAIWEARVGSLSTLDDGTVRGILDFEPRHLAAVAATLGAPGAPMVISASSGITMITSVSRGIRKTLVDGTLRLLHDVDPADRWRAFPLIGMPGESVLAAPLDPAKARLSVVAPHGGDAQILWRSRFFSRPAVWNALGGIEAYTRFISERPCAQSGLAHSADVTVVALKGSIYGVLPLCGKHRAYGTDPSRWPGGTAQAQRLLEMHWSQWAASALKEVIGQSRLRDCPPQIIRDWAARHGVAQFLPDEFGK